MILIPAGNCYTQRAVEMVTSGEVADALDLSKEEPDVVNRYGSKSKNLLTAQRPTSVLAGHARADPRIGVKRSA